jgi:hypothetical protein
VRAAFHIKTTVTKFTESTEKKKVKLNDLFAIDILSAMRMHMLYQSCLIFINQVESQKLSPVLKNLMNLLA